MSATRRKGSRGGRAATRAGGPPASNALTWAESLAAGEVAPNPSALEWAEGLGESAPSPSPWGSVAGAAPVPQEQDLSNPVDDGGTPVDPTTVEDGGSSPWGHVPTVDPADGDGTADANPWGAVAATEPAVTRGRGKASKTGKSRSKGKAKGKGVRPSRKSAPESDPTPTPAAGFPLIPGAAQDAAAPPSPEVNGDQLPALQPDAGWADEPDVAWTDEPDGAWADEPNDGPDAPESEPSSRTADAPSRTGRSRRKGRIPGTSTAQQKQITRTLRRGLPKALDKPIVLVLAGVVAAALGLGTGWGTTFFGTGGTTSAADAASCAQTQMAWTQAANAQSAMVEDQPETLRKGFINARDALEGVTPPDDIAKDWAVAFTYYSTVANNVEKVKKDDGPAVASAVGGAQKQLDTKAMVESFERVQEYVASNCAS